MKYSVIIQYILALYTVFVAVGSIVLFIKPLYPFYMTFLSFWILTVYMVLFFILPLKIRTALYGFCLTIHIIVPLVYWLFINGTISDHVSEISTIWNYFIHGSDLLVIFIHFLLFKNPLPYWTVFFNLVLITLYIAWAWVGYYLLGIFVYNFMNFSDPMAKFLYPGIYIAVFSLSFIWCWIHNLRNKRQKVNTDEV